MYLDITKNGRGDWNSLQGHEHDPNRFKPKRVYMRGAQQTYRYIVMQIYRYTDIQMFRYIVIQRYRDIDIQMYRYIVIQRYRYVENNITYICIYEKNIYTYIQYIYSFMYVFSCLLMYLIFKNSSCAYVCRFRKTFNHKKQDSEPHKTTEPAFSVAKLHPLP